MAGFTFEISTALSVVYLINNTTDSMMILACIKHAAVIFHLLTSVLDVFILEVSNSRWWREHYLEVLPEMS